MKNILIVAVFLMAICCKNIEKTNPIAKVKKLSCEIIADTINVTFEERFLNDYSIEKLKKREGLKSIKLDIRYSADSLQRYSFTLNGQKFKITVDSCMYNKNKFVTTFSKDAKIVVKHIVYIKDSIHFGFDNLIVDYKKSNYFLNQKGNILLIKNDEERAVGLASSWDFYQLISLDRQEMFEFYSFNDRYSQKIKKE